jgi:TPP-dependent pyruvate/acetoin dehydrogenase alpha subunit
MGGHATHDEREARDTFEPELFAHWGQRDPIGLFEAWLVREGIDPSDLTKIEDEVTVEMDEAANVALASRDRLPSPEKALYEGISEGGTLIGLENRPV